jgi:hypothetical protein
MVPATTTMHAEPMTTNPIYLPLCEYDDHRGPHSLIAVIDELTLTYDVIDHDGRPLRRHLPTLQAARAWAQAHCEAERP